MVYDSCNNGGWLCQVVNQYGMSIFTAVKIMIASGY